MHFQQNFESWTSGNEYIDRYIQDAQLSAHEDPGKVLEWIPYNRFYDIKYIEKIRAYKANWTDGYIGKWSNKIQNWNRFNQNMFVLLKCLSDPKNATLEFMNEV
jgi:hypothetical protein